MNTHPAACPHCGSTTVNQVQPDNQLRPARLNDDGSITIGDMVEGVDFTGPSLLFCHGCSSTYVQPAAVTEHFDQSVKNDVYDGVTVPGKDEPGYIGRNVRWLAIPDDVALGELIRAESETTAAMLYEALHTAWIHLYDHVHGHKPDEEALGVASNRLRQVAQRLYRQDSFNEDAPAIARGPRLGSPSGVFSELSPLDQMRWLACGVLFPDADESQRTYDAEALAKLVQEHLAPEIEHSSYAILVRFERPYGDDVEVAKGHWPDVTDERQLLLDQFAVELQSTYMIGELTGHWDLLGINVGSGSIDLSRGIAKALEIHERADASPLRPRHDLIQQLVDADPAGASRFFGYLRNLLVGQDVQAAVGGLSSDSRAFLSTLVTAYEDTSSEFDVEFVRQERRKVRVRAENEVTAREMATEQVFNSPHDGWDKDAGDFQVSQVSEVG